MRESRGNQAGFFCPLCETEVRAPSSRHARKVPREVMAEGEEHVCSSAVDSLLRQQTRAGKGENEVGR